MLRCNVFFTKSDEEVAARMSWTAPLDLPEIRRLLPHRPPLLLLDRVTALDPGVRGTAIRDIAADDVLLSGHFPGRPIVPGVVIVEACAQLGAVIMAAATVPPPPAPGDRRAAAADDDEPPRVGYLAAINRFKFLSPVVPGERLTLSVQIGKRMQLLVQLLAEVTCARRPVASGEVTVTLAAGTVAGTDTA